MNNKKIIIYGAGWTGQQLVRNLRDSSKGYKVVCFLDDDKSKKGTTVEGIKVFGAKDDFSKAIKKFEPDRIIIAMPSIDEKIRKEIYKMCLETGIPTNTIPDLPSLMTTSDIFELKQQIKIEDVIFRDIVGFSLNEINTLIKNQVCLVTGAGGSIGSELSRQIVRCEPKKIILLDIYENGVFDLAMELKEEGYHANIQIEILSVADYDACEKLFDKEKINLVFHAAAHKHVPLMEHNAAEAIKNNIKGTWNIAKLAEKYSVEKMVLVSSDKAVNPTNVMGATKRFCEKIMIYFANRQNKTNFAMVRFGNVIGSHGSVFHIFKRQIQNGGPVTLTHKEMTRFFMTIPEASSLILQCAVYANGGEIFVLDMGEPIKIINLAEKMISLSGYEPYKDIEIKEIGLRPGEKLYEEILMNTEKMRKTESGKIYICTQNTNINEHFEKCYEEIIDVANYNDNEKSIDVLKKYVETYMRKEVNSEEH